MVYTLIDNDNGHHTDQNVVDQRGAATPNQCRHCFTRWREQRCLYSYRELWVKWISALGGRFKICGNESLYCIYISSYWNGLPSVIFWKLILLGICIELLRNFFGGDTFLTLTISHTKRRYKKAYHLTPKCLNSELLHFALLHFPGYLQGKQLAQYSLVSY